jgi:hypothetical protein
MKQSLDIPGIGTGVSKISSSRGKLTSRGRVWNRARQGRDPLTQELLRSAS